MLSTTDFDSAIIRNVMGVTGLSVSQWHDFFSSLGSGAAALTGLVFVAMSLNPVVLTADPTHRYRAVGTLTGMASVFVVSELALMGGQNHVAVGVEWLVFSGVSALIFVHGYVLAIREGGSPESLRLGRIIAGSTLYLGEIAGAALLTLGKAFGFYLAAASTVLLLAYMITGAWLLVVGVSAISKQATH